MAETLRIDITGELSRPEAARSMPSGEDLYSIFAARASSLNAADNRLDSASPVLWYMNDAGAEDDRGGVLRNPWFQVSVPDDAKRAAPIQAFLACVDSVTRRVGELNIEAVELLIPQTSDPSELSRLLGQLNWFRAGSSAHRNVEITLSFDHASSDRLGLVVAALATSAQHDIRPFGRPRPPRIVDVSNAARSEFIANQIDPSAAVQFDVFMPGWTLDALGWAAAYISARLAGLKGVRHASIAFRAEGGWCQG